MADILTKKKRSELMSRIRSSGNEATELVLIRIFQENGITGWRRAQKIFGKPDFVFPKLRLAVFVDGCFWHGCPRHGTQPVGNAAFWREKISRNRARDRLVSRTLRSRGWKVMRIWEHELARKNREKISGKVAGGVHAENRQNCSAIPEKANAGRQSQKNQTARTPKMKIITDESCTGYSQPGHPENPLRISRTLEKLRGQTELPVIWAKPGSADDADILRAHTPDMLKRLGVPEDFDGDTPYYPDIPQYARSSAGAALDAMRLAWDGENVFSLMRPPGHHATRRSAMGFCFLNNVAIATLAAQAEGVGRVAVYDFDVHHGNGTEDILLGQPGAAFFSIHQYPCYPGGGAANVGENCFNYPVPPGLPREEYRQVLLRAMDELQAFEPDLVAVSAGFDAYAHDPLAQETLEAEDFHWLGKSLRGMGLPMFSVLEGGYSRELPELIMAYLKGVEGI